MANLKKELSFLEVVLVGVGIILGAGIYALIGKAALISGYGIWLSFIVAAFISALTGLSYAELSGLLPKCGAEYVYTKKAFNEMVGFVIGFLLLFSGIIGASTVALGFGGYLSSMIGVDPLLGALASLAASWWILNMGVKKSADFGVVGTIIEAGGLVLIIIFAVPFFGEYASSGRFMEIPSLASIMTAASLIFFAYIGFEEIVRLSEETKNGRTTIPKALIASIAITTVLYILVSIAAVSVASPEELGASPSPLAFVAERELGPISGMILGIVALFSTGNTILLLQLANSRLLFGMGSKSVFGIVDRKRKIPSNAIMGVTILAMMFALFNDIKLIAFISNFAVLASFIFVNLAVIALRKKMPNKKRPFKVPHIAIPFLGAVMSAALMASIEIEAIMYGMVLVGISIMFYRFRKSTGVGA